MPTKTDFSPIWTVLINFRTVFQLLEYDILSMKNPHFNMVKETIDKNHGPIWWKNF